MIITREECRMLARLWDGQYLASEGLAKAAPIALFHLQNKIIAEADKPDLFVFDSAENGVNVYRAPDLTIRRGDRVCILYHRGVMVGTVVNASLYRSYVHWDESDEIPVDWYHTWVETVKLTKGEAL